VKNGQPLVGDGREFVEAGALMSYGANMVDLSRRAATYVDKILSARSPPTSPWSSRLSSSWW
jgi:putative ABC transport system substrate-binding protein